jgi:hypothetical protein
MRSRGIEASIGRKRNRPPNLVRNEDSEAPWSVTEATGGLGAGEAIDDEGAEGFVLAVGSVGGLEKEGGEIR